jgi:filamentous hemagglutinin
MRGGLTPEVCACDRMSKGFRSIRDLERHFALHGNEFGLKTTVEYEAEAIAFLEGARRTQVQECKRKSSGELIRFDPTTQAYGVMTVTKIVLTYFKPRPCASVPHWEPR